MKLHAMSLTFLLFTCYIQAQQNHNNVAGEDKVIKTETEWKTHLTPAQYNICRLKATEMPGSGKYDKFYEKGYYKCVACGNRLFDSDTKYNSGSGWPSFFNPHHKKSLAFNKDTTSGMNRVEVTCFRCGSHLGHVFDDGPQPTGLRYCINSLALEFVAENKNDH